jgi:hypothetical protein
MPPELTANERKGQLYRPSSAEGPYTNDTPHIIQPQIPYF